MRGYTVVVIVGTMVKDPVLRTTTAGKDVASFTMAVNHRDKSASFIDCVAWGKSAETITQHIKKGDPLLVQGELKQRSWEHEGNKYNKIEAIVNTFAFMPSGKGNLPDNATSSSKDIIDENIDGPIDLSQIPF